METFTTSPWTSGSENHRTGSGFGVRIPKQIRAKLFQAHWTQVVLRIDGDEFDVAITPGFWNKCSELRNRRIGEWLIRHGCATWPTGSPPTLTVTHHGDNRFELSL